MSGRPSYSVLRRALGEGTESHTGWINFRCPFCSDNGEHFGVSPEGNASCWRCSTRLTRTQLLAHLRGTGATIIVDTEEKARRKKTLDLPRDVLMSKWRRITEKNRKDESLLVRRGVSYFMRRGVDLRFYEVGVFDGDNVPDFLLRYAFWLFRYREKPVFFQGRAIIKAKKKTFNPPFSGGWLRASDVLCFHDLIPLGSHLVITEGPFDAVAATDYEKKRYGVPLLGKNISERQVELLCRKAPCRLTVMLDPPGKDKTTEDATKTIERRLLRTGYPVYRVNYKNGEGRDPSDLGPALVSSYIKDAVESSFCGRPPT